MWPVRVWPVPLTLGVARRRATEYVVMPPIWAGERGQGTTPASEPTPMIPPVPVLVPVPTPASTAVRASAVPVPAPVTVPAGAAGVGGDLYPAARAAVAAAGSTSQAVAALQELGAAHDAPLDHGSAFLLAMVIQEQQPPPPQVAEADLPMSVGVMALVTAGSPMARDAVQRDLGLTAAEAATAVRLLQERGAAS